MQIGPARDQIVRVLQRITLPFVRGDTVLRADLHKAVEELRTLVDHLPAEHPKPPAPIVATPVVEQPAPIVLTEVGLDERVIGNPPTVHPRVEPQMSATPHQPVPEPFPLPDTQSASDPFPDGRGQAVARARYAQEAAKARG